MRPPFIANENGLFANTFRGNGDNKTRPPLTEEGSREFPEEERPELRVLLGGLASALSGWLKSKLPEQPEQVGISRLRALYRSDPLPEVRRSFSSA